MARRSDERSPATLLQQGDRAGAIAGYRRQAEDGDVQGMFYAGTLLAEDGDPEGLTWLQRAHEAAPSEAAIRNNLGHALREAGRLEAARQVFEAAVRDRPGDAASQYGLATVFVKLGQLDLAEPVLRRAVQADPTFVHAVRQHGDVLAGLGRAREAMEVFTQALALQPKDAQVVRKLGLMHAFLGRKSMAVAMLRQALSLRPDDALATHMLDALTGTDRPVADEAYVRELFEAFADTFDTHLQDVLDYRVPARIVEVLGTDPLGRVLDLGCGTGLLADHLGYRACLDGVDLSAGMLAKARARGGYDRLVEASLEDFLGDCEPYDVVVAADVFVYVGQLDGVFAAVRARCSDRFVFTTELAETGLELRPSGRYAHGVDRIDALTERHGFRLESRTIEPLRTDAGVPVMGQLVVLR